MSNSIEPRGNPSIPIIFEPPSLISQHANAPGSESGPELDAARGRTGFNALNDYGFLNNESEMADRIFSFDWSSYPMGGPDSWPVSLCSTVGLMLSSQLPMYIAWGDDGHLLYNDSYIPILGAKHPCALGSTIREVWDEIWPDLKPVVARALGGVSTFRRDAPRILQRNNVAEQTYFTFSTSSIFNSDASIGGVLCICLETTKVVAERAVAASESERLRELFSQAPSFMAVLRGPDHMFEIANAAYLKMVGKHDVVGKSVRAAFPEIEGNAFFELLDRVYSTGEAIVGKRSFALAREIASIAAPSMYVDFVLQPLRDATGRVNGIFLAGNDVTESALADYKRIESERLSRATIDALTAHIAVVDATGKIIAVNKAWNDYSAANGGEAEAVLNGANYLQICDRAAQNGVKDAADVAAMIREIASGKRDIATIEYPCHSPSQEVWFSVSITRSSGEGPMILVISHDNITDRRKNEKKIEHLATRDALTSLTNRNALADHASRAIDGAKTDDAGLAVIFLDLDNFKHLNDAYGHSAGDEALVHVAAVLRGLTGRRDTVARLGGDEFVVLLTNLGNASIDAEEVARTMLDQISRPINLADSEVQITASIGISIFPRDGRTFPELLRNADAAMYAAKDIGRNAVEFYAVSMSTKANERLAVETDLRRALRLDQFELHYQPQVSTATGAIIGVEALIRWRHPEAGLVSPGLFIPVAEETGIILPIGEWVLKAACQQIKLWQTGPFSAIPVAINISPVQLRQPDFVEMIARTLHEAGVEPNRLELEITETMVMSRDECMIERLKAIKALGVTLSIDDFGTGYSNLGYLSSFPLDRLKIDQSFVRDLPDPRAVSIVTAIVGMAHSLGLQVIAEGVESAEQARFLADIGCEQSQGFFYCAPLAATDLEGWMRKSAQRAA